LGPLEGSDQGLMYGGAEQYHDDYATTVAFLAEIRKERFQNTSLQLYR
jgi:hypothetical protein